MCNATNVIRCVSRQLWWGHRVPVWYPDTAAMGSDSADAAAAGDGGEAYFVARDEDDAKAQAAAKGYGGGDASKVCTGVYRCGVDAHAHCVSSRSTVQGIALHCQDIAVRNAVRWNCTALLRQCRAMGATRQCSAMELHCIVFATQCTAMRCHCIALYCITVRCTALRCAAMP